MDKQDNINVLQRKLDEAEDDNTDIMYELVKHETKKCVRAAKHKSDNNLRDWFAGLAMQCELACQSDATGCYVNKSELANVAYEYADAMMRARKK